MGIVARDSTSVCIVVSSPEVSATSSAMTEVPTILEDRVLAKYLQFQEVVIEYDVMDIIHSIISASLSCAWELLPILSRAQEVGMTLQAYFWSWVPRSSNMVADYVAVHHSHEICDLG